MGFFDFFKPKQIHFPLSESLKSKEDKIHFSKVEKFVDGEIVAFAYFPKFVNDLFGVEIIKDEFTNVITKEPFYIHSSKSDKVMLFSKYGSIFKIGLRTIGEIDFLTLEAYQKEIKFLQGDKLSLLFEDGIIWEYEIQNKGSRKDKDSEGVLFESFIEISAEKIVYLSEVPLQKWKYYNSKTDQVYTNQVDSEKQGKIIEMAKMMDLVKTLEIKGL